MKQLEDNEMFRNCSINIKQRLPVQLSRQTVMLDILAVMLMNSELRAEPRHRFSASHPTEQGIIILHTAELYWTL